MMTKVSTHASTTPPTSPSFPTTASRYLTNRPCWPEFANGDHNGRVTRLARDHWQRRIAALDPETEHAEIARLLSAHEFPWDMVQALSFALFRTYAVPSIGDLLHDTGEFTERVQKRYDDTGLLLEQILEHGLPSAPGRTAVRRINQMHGHYPISNDDFRYVLSTFVVVPVRWIDAHGYRRLTDHERRAQTNYYRHLGRHMAIKHIPETYPEFERLLDDYEAAHFAYSAKARRVADATLDLMTTFPPNDKAPARAAKRFAFALMDDPLLDAFRYPRPRRWERWAAGTALRARALLIGRMPAREKPRYVRDMGYYRTYPQGFEVEQLGTFPSAEVG
jgi:hypothetical protein